MKEEKKRVVKFKKEESHQERKRTYIRLPCRIRDTLTFDPHLIVAGLSESRARGSKSASKRVLKLHTHTHTHLSI